MNESTNPNDGMTGVDAMRFIDRSARHILNETIYGDGGLDDLPAYDDHLMISEIFNDAVESAAAAATDDIDTMNLLHDLLFARIFQLLYNQSLTEEAS